MGTLQTNPPTLPNTEVDSWQPLVERDAMSYYGLNKVTLTNWSYSSTAMPQIAQGSMIDIDGSLAYFAADEAIGGAPNDGAVYVYFLVVGSTVTAELTNTAPEWYADKGGFYDATGNRYSGHTCFKDGAEYKDKRKYNDGPEWQLTLFTRAFTGIAAADTHHDISNLYEISDRVVMISGTLKSSAGDQWYGTGDSSSLIPWFLLNAEGATNFTMTITVSADSQLYGQPYRIHLAYMDSFDD